MANERGREELAAELRAGADTGVLAGLGGVDLADTDLAGADLIRAHLLGADLRSANLREADLCGADLRGADLCDACLCDARLREADLREADLRGADLRGVDVLHADLRGADLSETDLRNTNLEPAHLTGAYFVGADLRGAGFGDNDLRDTDFSGANLSGILFGGADLGGSDLRGSDLRNAGFCDTSLRGADLGGSYLDGAGFYRVDLRGASFCNARLHGTRVNEADLRGVDFTEADLAGAVFVNQELPESIVRARDVSGILVDWRTVARSLRWDRLYAFLVRTGMPEVVVLYLIDSIRTIDAMDLFTMLQSVFLSFGGPDQAFADRLREALTVNGVKTWFYPRDAVPGSRHHRHMQAQIQAYDRMILCCSVDSLQREGVLHEVEEVLEREQEEGGSEVMIPVLVEPIFETGSVQPTWWPADKEHVYRALRRRVAADFRGAMNDEEKWTEQIRRVLGALRKRPEK